MIEWLITSSILILAVFLLRWVTKGKISMRFRYALWLAVVLRLVLPVPVADSALSIMNLLPADGMALEEDLLAHILEGEDKLIKTGDREAASEGDAAGLDISATDGNIGSVYTDWENVNKEAGALSESLTGQEQKPGKNSASAELTAGTASGADRMITGTFQGIPGILRIVWMIGTLSVGAYMIISQIRFRRILYRRRRIAREWEIPDEMADRLAVRGMKVYQVNGLASPCLVGRDIYVDMKLLQERQKLIHVLAHEYCHGVQFDRLWVFLRSVLAAVYWFHPLVWAAAFAARQDSELACDEMVIRLLGEEERFAYGRTLLYLLSGGKGRVDCAGTALTMEGSKRGVKERVHMIARNTEHKKWAVAAVIVGMLFVCGCAFTGSEEGKSALQEGKEGAPQEGHTSEMVIAQADRQQVVGDEADAEFERIRKEYEDTVGALDAQGQELEKVQQDYAFLSVLHGQGVMAGRDDSELALDRKLDYQAYYDYLNEKQDGQGKEQKDSPENGWYLLCRNEEAQVSLYGLYTREFGPRGIKTLIGEDVNTYDIAWCPSGMNEDSANIRTLESAQDGFPRSFVFKILAENTSDREIWKLYSGFRYDTGTVEIEELTAQMYRDWVDRNLSFTVSESGEQVLITYDEDMALAPLDISAYQDQKVEGVAISTDVAGFQLDNDISAGEGYEGQSGYEGVVLHLAVGLKLEGMEGVWFEGLHPLTVQVLCHPGQEPAFVLQQPRVEEEGNLRSLSQERKLEEIRSGKGVDMQSDEAAGYLSSPLVNNTEAHHDLEIIFLNPCPDHDRISDGYGERTHPVTGEIKRHNGVDMAAKKGSAVVAAADGRVYETGFDAEDGNYVVLWHGQSGQMTYYTHCEEVLVSKGDPVSAGDKIATVGSTGRSTGSHLHFAVSCGGEWQEPIWDKE